MSGVDNRIVTMQFNNAEFERNARTSLTTLQRIKESMNFGSIAAGTIRSLSAIQNALGKIGLKTPFGALISGADKGLGMVGGVLDKLGLKNPFATSTKGAQELGKAAADAGGPNGMGVLTGGVTAVSSKFIALSTIAITALSNIVNRAVNAGIAFGKSFSTAPILQGLHEYELNLKSIQTIQANTDRPLKEVEASLDALNRYSDQTIYNFAEMARNVGTFTAAGVDLKTSVSSIKGIANIAALSGSSSEQAATAMYQLSQAIAAGKVGLMDWNSVVNAGMGGKKLQNALAQTAIAMGEIKAESVKMVGPMKKLEINGNSFRESIMAKPGEESWLSSEALVNTLATMDGRFSKAALKAELLEDGTRKYADAAAVAEQIEKNRNELAKKGVVYTDEQFAALQKMSTAAFKSATEVKTLGQVFDIAKETIASGWAASFENVFGNLKEAKTLFTGISDGLNGIIRDNALARNEMLAAWKKRGGRDTLIDGLHNAWEAVLGIMKPVKKALRDIFPKTTVRDLLDLTRGFETFTEKLIPSKATMKDIRSIAGGMFAVLSIGKTIFMGVVDGVQALFGAVGGGEGKILDFAAGIGEMIKEFDEFLKRSNVVSDFFIGLGQILAIPVEILKGVASLIGDLFGGFKQSEASGVSDSIGKVSDKLSGLERVTQWIGDFFAGLSGKFRDLGEAIGNGLVGLGDLIASFLTSDAFGPALDAINTGLLGAITVMLVKFFKGGGIDVTGGLFGKIGDVVDEATGALTAMQTNLKANALLKIGISIAVLAGALLILSTINPKDMAKALTAMTFGFGILVGSLVALLKFMGPAGIAQIWVVSSAITKLAFAMLILATAVKLMASMNLGTMLRGLFGMALAIGILYKAIMPMAAGSAGMIKASAALILLGLAINILAVGLKLLATMTWEELIKGLAGLTGVLLALTIGLQAMPSLNAEAVTLIALALAINILAIALKVFATMSWEEMAKGLLMLTGALGGIALAMRAMPKGILLQSAALVAVAGAMLVLAGALKIMGGMGWEEIAKGLVVMGGAFLIMALGLQAIGLVGAVGALGVLAVAAAMAVLLPVLLAFGAMGWENILKSLTMLAGIFTVLGLAAYILAPLTPVIIGLGLALLLLGAGLALAGVGAMAMATAFGIVVAAGSAGAQVMKDLLQGIIDMIPPALAAFGRGIVLFAQAIGKGAPKIATAFGRVLNNLLTQVNKAIPKIGKVITNLIETFLRIVVQAAPKIANAGMKVMLALLGALDKNLPKLIDRGVSVATKFMDGIGRNAGKLANSGAKMILKVMEGIADAIRNNSEEFGRAGADIGLAIVDGIQNAIEGAAGRLAEAAKNVAGDVVQGVKDFIGVGGPSKLFCEEVGKPMMDGWAGGIEKATPTVMGAIDGAKKGTVNHMAQAMKELEDTMSIDPNASPVVTPVLDLTSLTKEANKMSSILSAAPIVPTVSYATAADISAATQASPSDDGSGGKGGGGRGGDTYNYTQILQSPQPIDSIESYRKGRSLLAMKKYQVTTTDKEEED